MRTRFDRESRRCAPWLGTLAALTVVAGCDGIAVVGSSLRTTTDASSDMGTPGDDVVKVGDVETPDASDDVTEAAVDAAPRCMTNADCATSAAGPICDTVSGSCTTRCSGHMDCTSSMTGNICNPMTNMCVARCAADNDCVAHPNGAVCDTTSGACVAPCRANSDCTMSAAGPVCDTMTGRCGRTCRSTMDCAGTPTTICASMTCVERCTGNADCAGHPDGTTCNPMSGRCVAPCRSNTDCASNPAGAICDAMSGLCSTRCASHSDCTGTMNTICSPTTRMCVARCTANADCAGHAGGAVCETTAGRCVVCVPSSDTCSPDRHCDPTSNTCVAGCRADEGCPRATLDDGGVGAQLRCNTMTRVCEQCVTDAHCATGQRCSAGACVAGCSDDSRCAPGERCCGGACVNPQTNDQNCGMCGTRCSVANGDPGCATGACTIARCTAPFADCDTSVANGCETNTNTVLTHCGRCGNACPTPANARANCTAGACGFTCNDGFADCNGNSSDGCETNITNAVDNCGACGRACNAPNGTAACAMGACTVGACNAGFADCDRTAANGCEVNTNTTVGHCGRCSNACPDPRNGTAACTSGACGIASCDSGFADCNMSAADGCEVNTRSSATHCGACGRLCEIANGTARCADGVCAVGTCNAGFADCDGNAANGCETNLNTSVGNCGRCDNACSASNGTAVCRAGSCAVGACNTGFADCDMLATNGCEVNTQTDVRHCNGCGNACRLPGGTNVCARGTCAVSSCATGLGDCDANPGNGCETNLTSTLTHCGACGVVCATPANATAACVTGACGIESCNAGFGNCDGSTSNGCEANLATSTAHCGRCGNACPARPNMTASCAVGVCAYACNVGFADCDGNAANGCETNLSTDTSHCGVCRRSCPAAVGGGAACTAGVCGQTCPSGQSNCTGTCRATQTDTNHCGACGRVCVIPNASAACVAGTCGIGSCNTGFANCDGNASNGCETATSASVSNCGACGRVCPTPTGGIATCTSGVCGGTCPTGRALCGGVCRDLLTDNTNCGGCGRACGSTQTCVNGACVGTGVLRFTLTWSRPGDMDFHIVPPCRTEIYYGRTTACGGTLDRDDTTGTGPENIFWGAAATPGEYLVCVNPFSITGPTTATVQIYNRGVLARTFTASYTTSSGLVPCSRSSRFFLGSYTF